MSEIVLYSNTLPISAGDMTGNLSSGLIDLAYANGYCVQATWTGTPTGTLAIQGSNNPSLLGWNTIASDSIAGAAGTYFSNQVAQNYQYLQVIYTVSSGSGTLNVGVSLKRGNS